MVSRDQRNPIVLQKVRKQGIRPGTNEHKRFWQEIIYKSVIPTSDKHTVMTNKPKVGIKLL